MSVISSKTSAMGAGSPVAQGRTAVEWPTVALIALAYGCWLGVTLQYGHWPLWVVAPVTSVLLTLHSSLQHEILHGHPTRWRKLNRLFGIVPLSLWLPYERYRQTHLVHHLDERLTDPLDDPESWYWMPEDWARLNPANRWLIRAQTTLAGRIVIGPAWSVARFIGAEARRVVRNDGHARRIWAEHLVWCVPVVVWVVGVCHIPLWLYLLAMVYPGTGILLIRSFAEHRARPGARERTAIVENSWILGPLFLFNNLHSVHHEEPMTPWYRYNAWYQAHRERLIRDNGGLVYDSYLDVARRFLFWSHDVPQHPLGRAPRPAADAREAA